MYYKFKENIVGGPSIILPRYLEKDKNAHSAVRNYVNDFGELMRMPYTFGLYYNQCQPGTMLGEGKETISRKKSISIK